MNPAEWYARVAERHGMSRTTLSRVINDKAAISPDLAITEARTALIVDAKAVLPGAIGLGSRKRGMGNFLEPGLAQIRHRTRSGRKMTHKKKGQ